MIDQKTDWEKKGFAKLPKLQASGDSGVLLYRCWGHRLPGIGSSELGSGFFSLERPASVLEAELRLNIVDWGNGVHFVSTFLLKPGFSYWSGPVAHGASDVRLPATQVFVEPPIGIKVKLIKPRELLRQDVFVGSTNGHAN